jgi:hypothetical protein
LVAVDSIPRTTLLFAGRGMIRVSKGVLPVHAESLMLGVMERAKFITVEKVARSVSAEDKH